MPTRKEAPKNIESISTAQMLEPDESSGPSEKFTTEVEMGLYKGKYKEVVVVGFNTSEILSQEAQLMEDFATAIVLN